MGIAELKVYLGGIINGSERSYQDTEVKFQLILVETVERQDRLDITENGLSVKGSDPRLNTLITRP